MTATTAVRKRLGSSRPSPATELNLFDANLALQEAVAREGGGWGIDRLREIGAVAGSDEAREHADRAERNGPSLETHDRNGNLDHVRCDPSWDWLLAAAINREAHSLPWRTPRPGAHVVRAALTYIWTELDTSVMCPVIMTFAAVPVLTAHAPALAERWQARLTSPDPERVALAGQAFTEKQGGSDVRANTTRAKPAGDGSYKLWGHKWFCSAPTCDVFLTLAQTDAGPSCFLIERDAGFAIVRLKDKLGTRALPSAEVEFRGVRGWLVGEEGAGLAPLVHNLSYARLWPSGAPEMRAATVAAIRHCRRRFVRGIALSEHPAMANVLADLAIESEAATATALRLAAAYEDFGSPFRRLATTVAKYWGSQRAPGHIAEALQCLGGDGYGEDSRMPRLLRDGIVHAIWEGPGNVMALDVLRSMRKDPASLEALVGECLLAAGADRHLDRHLDRVRARCAAALAAGGPAELDARRTVEDLALALQASLLVRHAPAAIADAFCAARLQSDRGRAYGTLPAGVRTRAILERALPA